MSKLLEVVESVSENNNGSELAFEIKMEDVSVKDPPNLISIGLRSTSLGHHVFPQHLVIVVMSLEFAVKFQPGDKREQKNICCKSTDD